MDGEASLAQLLVVGLLSGAGGAVLATWIRTRHERLERLRERMLTAADEYAQAAEEVFEAAWAAQGDPGPEAVAHVRQRVHTVLMRSSRLTLVFGVESATDDEATRTNGWLIAFNALLDEDPPDLNEARDALGNAIDAHVDFVEAAHADLTSSRLWRRARRRFRRAAAEKKPWAADPHDQTADPGI